MLAADYERGKSSSRQAVVCLHCIDQDRCSSVVKGKIVLWLHGGVLHGKDCSLGIMQTMNQILVSETARVGICVIYMYERLRISGKIYAFRRTIGFKPRPECFVMYGICRTRFCN